MDVARIAALRSQGCSWSVIRQETGIAKGDGTPGVLYPVWNWCISDALIVCQRILDLRCDALLRAFGRGTPALFALPLFNTWGCSQQLATDAMGKQYAVSRG